MLITKDSPIGIDIPVQRLQKFLYNELISVWGLNDAQWASYGRCYKNQDAKGYIPEVYIGGNEYKEVFYNDNFPVISFFGVEDEMKIDVTNHAGVFLIFEMDISKVKPLVPHRGDEEIHTDVLNQLKMPRYGFSVTGLDTGIELVYKEFILYRRQSGQKTNTKAIRFRDMHPFHCFRINMNLNYKNINC